MKRVLFGLALSLTANLYAEEVEEAKQADTTVDNVEWEKLKSAASAYVKAFNGKDAGSIAGLFAEEGEILLSENVKIAGYDAIEQYYTRVFDSHPTAQVGLEATSVYFETPELVVEEGAVVFSEGENVMSTHYYAAIIGKQEDGSWKILQSRNREVIDSAANQALDEISGIVGEWVSNWEDSSYKVDFRWDPSGAWIEGQARYISPDIEPMHTTIRIGWDAASSKIVSWSFDSLGGYSKSTWERGENEWIMRATGVNAQGEVTTGSQSVAVEGDRSVRWKFTERVVAGEKEEDFEMRLVKTPPKPFTTPKGE